MSSSEQCLDELKEGLARPQRKVLEYREPRHGYWAWIAAIFILAVGSGIVGDLNSSRLEARSPFETNPFVPVLPLVEELIAAIMVLFWTLFPFMLRSAWRRYERKGKEEVRAIYIDERLVCTICRGPVHLKVPPSYDNPPNAFLLGIVGILFFSLFNRISVRYECSNCGPVPVENMPVIDRFKLAGIRILFFVLAFAILGGGTWLILLLTHNSKVSK
jgi:hypothetical protein